MLNVTVVSIALFNAASASARDVDLDMSSLTSRWILWLACVGVIFTGDEKASSEACVMNCGGENWGGIIYFCHEYPPGFWEGGDTYNGGDEVGGSVTGEDTLIGGLDEARSRLISVTSSFTDFIR